MDEGYSTEVRNAVSKEDARKRRDEVIAEAFEERYPVLIDALPSVGKSYGIVRWAAETGNPVSVFTARRDL